MLHPDDFLPTYIDSSKHRDVDRQELHLSQASVTVVQSESASIIERGKRVREKCIAPRGTIQGNTLTENRPARTAGSCSFNNRAFSGSTFMIVSPRNASAGPPRRGPAASK